MTSKNPSAVIFPRAPAKCFDQPGDWYTCSLASGSLLESFMKPWQVRIRVNPLGQVKQVVAWESFGLYKNYRWDNETLGYISTQTKPKNRTYFNWSPSWKTTFLDQDPWNHCRTKQIIRQIPGRTFWENDFLHFFWVKIEISDHPNTYLSG